GWCTYGVGDQMSHYGLNAGLPKTLIQHLIRWVISSGLVDAHTAGVLQAVLETTISPELVPAQGEQVQPTEEKIGPYAMQAFTSSTCCAAAWPRGTSPSWPTTPGATWRRAAGRRGTRSPLAPPMTWPRSGTGWKSSSTGSSLPSSSARLSRTGRRWSVAGRSHRGGSGAHRPTAVGPPGSRTCSGCPGSGRATEQIPAEAARC